MLFIYVLPLGIYCCQFSSPSSTFPPLPPTNQTNMVGLILLALLFLFGLFFTRLLIPKSLSKLLSSSNIPQQTQTVYHENKPNTETTSPPPRQELEDNKHEEIDTVFSTFDSDKDGFITVPELQDSLLKMGISSTSEEVKSMLRRLDSNGDGFIELAEFRENYSSIMGVKEKSDVKGMEEEMEMKAAFDIFDDNGDGHITVEELGMVLTSMGMKEGRNCMDMIKKVDVDGDGKVSFEEFKQMMKVKDGNNFF